MPLAGPLLNPTCEGSLTIGATLLNGPAWMVTGLAQLWGLTFDLRGKEVTLPYGQGQVVYPRWRNAARYSLPMLISGHAKPDGTPEFRDPMAGLASNVRRLRATGDVTPADPTVSATYTKTATLTLPDGRTMQGTVLPLGITVGSVTRGVMNATLDLLLPDGYFTELSGTATATAAACP